MALEKYVSCSQYRVELYKAYSLVKPIVYFTPLFWLKHWEPRGSGASGGPQTPWKDKFSDSPRWRHLLANLILS